MSSRKQAFNMASLIRTALAENPHMTSQEMIAEINRQYPGYKINKNSFSVAFYTQRQRQNGTAPIGKKRRVVTGRSAAGRCDLDVMRSAAEFLRTAGGFDNAVSAIKMVQSVQLK